ncbi:Solute carrier 25 [Cyanidiococcus yangmingshanensis]|uniref:Solute carrier 25 n=1 Tax=Cyanidiococcus yangmingshanensis TaxID=2690220 RepID=A0A7J7IJ18_9RHOD|nr:Solute carrier 25 [Cyanidiococcus yangmingshanensis]
MDRSMVAVHWDARTVRLCPQPIGADFQTGRRRCWTSYGGGSRPGEDSTFLELRSELRDSSSAYSMSQRRFALSKSRVREDVGTRRFVGFASPVARRRASEVEEEARGSSLKSSVQPRATSKQPAWKYLISGALAGVVSRTAVSPLEVVATMNMSSSIATRNFVHEMMDIFRREGIPGLFKGNLANCLKVAPTKGIQFVVFEAFKRLMARRRQWSQARRAARRPGEGLLVEELEDIELTAGERLIAGGIAGMAAAVICYPLEVSKTLLTAEPGRYHGVIGTLRALVQERGFGALYRGLAPTMVAMFPYVGLEFMVYEQLKLTIVNRRALAIASAESGPSKPHRNSRLGREIQNEQPPIALLLLIGAIAGTVAQTACHPLDVIRKRLQLQGIGNRPVQYKSMIHVAQEIIKNEGGIRALYKGLSPAATSVFPSAGVSYLVYEWCKSMLGARSL